MHEPPDSLALAALASALRSAVWGTAGALTAAIWYRFGGFVDVSALPFTAVYPIVTASVWIERSAPLGDDEDDMNVPHVPSPVRLAIQLARELASEEGVSELITTEVRDAVERSVLCWLATSDENGQPNVSPKEAFAVADRHTIVVANIASPRSAKNIRVNGKVCLSFVDVFVQKGFKVMGSATEMKPSETEYSRWVRPLRAVIGDRFPIRSVFIVRVVAVEPIVVPSYHLFPAETTEASQVQAALRTYGVVRDEDAEHGP